MRAISMFLLTVRGKVTQTVSENHTFLRAEAEPNRGPLAYQLGVLKKKSETSMTTSVMKQDPNTGSKECCSLSQNTTRGFSGLCFVLINSVLWNLSCV